AQKVTDARKEREAEAAREAREAREEAMRPDVVAPAQGRLTSGFGARWGTTHYGLDIANSIGTPIVAAADGTVIEAGPASGFGNWVRIQHDDGTVTVYGHMYTYSVAEGQRVKAGEQIAEIGNAGQSTGPHLHFEVWLGENGTKIDPLSWLTENGVNL
ncbi:MAG: M23 family metallopeptidase, partial [Thermocrispum sp.]